MVVEAAKQLAEQGISARVESFHTIKPIDKERLAELFSSYPLVAAIEEHSRIGGLAGSIAEWLAAQEGQRAGFINFGTDDVFMHEIGSQAYARRKFGLTSENIAKQVQMKLDTLPIQQRSATAFG